MHFVCLRLPQTLLYVCEQQRLCRACAEPLIVAYVNVVIKYMYFIFSSARLENCMRRCAHDVHTVYILRVKND